MSQHVAQWVTASPLWTDALTGGEQATQSALMRKPALLRFEHDSFMDDVTQLLERDPATLADRVAKPISYRLPAPGESEPPAPSDLKLYQAIHGHHYLIAATLVCRLPGLPEREVNSAAGERVRFVLRRVDDASSGEWAWVDDGKPGSGRRWKLLDATQRAGVDTNEDLFPLFPLRYSSGTRKRRLFVGLVPTASGDTFKAAGALSPLAGPESGRGAPPRDPRPAALKAKVTDPLRALGAAQTEAPDGVADRATVTQAMLNGQIEASRFLLLDFAEFLHANFGWFASGLPQRPSDPSAAVLWDQLGAPAQSGIPLSWIAALATAWGERLIISGDATGQSSLSLNLHTPGVTPDELDGWVTAALPSLPPTTGPAPPTSIQGDVIGAPAVAKLDGGFTPQTPARYVIRCVYQRPTCGPLHPDVVSEPTDAFQIASFFDFDAPSRSIVIPLPINTGIKDLRKLRKNVSFLISNQLRAQLNQVTNLKDALDGKLASGESFDLGLMCSFSIPVITICALIVLMIFINLLNIVFWWAPFLRICFPILRKAD